VSSSDLTVAIPFLVNALLAFISPFLGLAIENRLEGELSRWFTTDKAEEGSMINPPTLAHASVWVGDATQTLVTAVGPLVGLLLLKPSALSGLGILYVIACVLAVAAFFGFVYRVPIAGYGSWHVPLLRWRVPLYSPLASAGLLLNLLAAGAAAVIGQ
jgi:hypothetical protein